MKNDYRAYWEALKTEIIEMLASDNDEIRESGKEIKALVEKIEKQQAREYYGEY